MTSTEASVSLTMCEGVALRELGSQGRGVGAGCGALVVLGDGEVDHRAIWAATRLTAATGSPKSSVSMPPG